jgi:nitrile hydratase
MTDNTAPASVAQRAEALKSLLTEKGLLPDGFIDEHMRQVEEQWVSSNGARMVARAWSDHDFRTRLLKNGKSAAAEMGFAMPSHHRQLVVLENKPEIHNLIVCSQCSCTAFTIIGAPPAWYKDLEYRARAVRQARTVLNEMGLELPRATELRVWDTTADTRYMVLPLQPDATKGWSAEKLTTIVTQDCMIGVAVPKAG